MRHTIDDDAALTANTLAAVRVKCDGLFALSGEVLVEHVQHLKEGHITGNTVQGVLDEAALILGIALTPDSQVDLHL
jgi:hypothetical protein